MGEKAGVAAVIGCWVGSGMAGILGSIWQPVRQTIRADENGRRIDFMKGNLSKMNFRNLRVVNRIWLPELCLAL
jgi:hypothetical protein